MNGTSVGVHPVRDALSLCAMPFDRLPKSIAHRVRSYMAASNSDD